MYFDLSLLQLYYVIVLTWTKGPVLKVYESLSTESGRNLPLNEMFMSTESTGAPLWPSTVVQNGQTTH